MTDIQIRAAAREFVRSCYPSFDDLQLDPGALDQSAAIVARLLDGWLVRVVVVVGMAVCSVVVLPDGSARRPTADDLEVGRAAVLDRLRWVGAAADSSEDPPVARPARRRARRPARPGAPRRPAPADQCSAR